MTRYPSHVSIETFHGCNARCTFCHVDQWSRQEGQMTDHIFNTILKQLDGWGQSHLQQTALMLNGEPLFDNKLEGQLTFDYRGPSESAQGKNLSSYGLDFSLSKDVFKNKKGTISLTVRDLTKSRVRRYERGGKPEDNYFTEGEYSWRRTQEFRLSLQYRINQNKRRGGQRGGFDQSDFQGGSGIFGN